jgi:hypothetical protein
MDINFHEYSEKLEQFINGVITEKEWIDYCSAILEDVMKAKEEKD